MSLCGWEPEPDAARFDECSVSFIDFCNNPLLLDDPNLVVSIRGKYYNWRVAGPMILSMMVFNRPLLQTSVDQLRNIHMHSTKDNKQESRSWWSWRRSKTSRETTPAVEKPPIPSQTTVASGENKDTSIDIGDEVLMEEKECIVEMSPKSSLSEKCRKTLRLSSKQIVCALFYIASWIMSFS